MFYLASNEVPKQSPIDSLSSKSADVTAYLLSAGVDIVYNNVSKPDTSPRERGIQTHPVPRADTIFHSVQMSARVVVVE